MGEGDLGGAVGVGVLEADEAVQRAHTHRPRVRSRGGHRHVQLPVTDS